MTYFLRHAFSRGFGVLQNPPAKNILEDGKVEIVPGFAKAGITDHTMILKELIKGSPAASLHLGKEASLFIIPKHLLIYHSPVAAHLLSSTRSNTLALPHVDPDTFFHIERWMRQDKLDIISQFNCTFIDSDIQDACTLLCRMYTAAIHLGIVPIEPVILEELRMTFEAARVSDRQTPVVAKTVMEVWQVSHEECMLWKLLVEELCVAFSGEPRPVFAEWEECFQAIEPLRLVVTTAMTDRILLRNGCKTVKVR